MLRKTIKEGGCYPDPLKKTAWWPYGVAWDDINTNTVICYPVPLNWVAGFCRWIYFHYKLRHNPWLTSILIMQRNPDSAMAKAIAERVLDQCRYKGYPSRKYKYVDPWD